MRKLLLISFLLSFIVAANAQVDNMLQFKQFEKKSVDARMKFQASSETNNYDIIYHRLLWEVNPAEAYIKGEVTSYFKALSANVSSISFDIIDALDVDSVKQNGLALSYVHENNLVKINLTSPIGAGVLDSLTIYYKGVPQSLTGFGSFMNGFHENVPILWTLSEPYGAREWWPCKQSLTDKIDSVDIYIKTPKAYRVGSNGKLIFEKIEGDKKLTYWKHRYPIAAYLVAIAVTNYASYSHIASVDKTNTVEIVNYVYPENLESAKLQTAFTVKVMELFSEIFIPYPFHKEKYGHAQFGWGGGMEHQTMSFMVNFSEHLITHELAHQWFGDHVTCSSWQHIWINEGFAVFGECVAQEHLYPENWLTWKKERMAIVLNKTRSGSIFVVDTTDVGRIFNSALTYQKGGLILQMLRDQVGDSAFFKGIKALLTHEKTSGGFASAEDVRIYIEEAADTSLTTFFSNWYYGQGYPEYTLNWIQNLNNEVTLKISQSTTHVSVPFFAMHVPVLLKGANNELTVRLHNTVNNESFIISPDFEVKEIIFDPEHNIISPHPANIVLGIEERGQDLHIKIMPNPAKSSLTIKAAKNIEIIKYDIIDLSGKQVYKDNKPDTSRKFDINIASFPAGIYYLRMETNEGAVINKFAKSN